MQRTNPDSMMLFNLASMLLSQQQQQQQQQQQPAQISSSNTTSSNSCAGMPTVYQQSASTVEKRKSLHVDGGEELTAQQCSPRAVKQRVDDAAAAAAMHLGSKMVRGQEEWVNNSRKNFISQILKCLECSASFETLEQLSAHMLKTNHFSKFQHIQPHLVSQQQQQQQQHHHQQQQHSVLAQTTENLAPKSAQPASSINNKKHNLSSPHNMQPSKKFKVNNKKIVPHCLFYTYLQTRGTYFVYIRI
jgi:hypothetical protein